MLLMRNTRSTKPRWDLPAGNSGSLLRGSCKISRY
jgi:hypothetical protein